MSHESSRIDPIEVCSMLIEAMDGKEIELFSSLRKFD
jgi:hypothetical protein